MHNIFLIARREYLERIRTRAFVVMTVLIPVIMIGSLALPQLFASRESGAIKRLVIVAHDRQTAEVIGGLLTSAKGHENKQEQGGMSQGLPETTPYQIEIDTNVSGEERALLSGKVKNKQIDGVLWASRDALAAKKIPYITKNQSLTESRRLEDDISHALQREALRNKGLTDADIDSAMREAELVIESPNGSKGNPLGTFIAMILLITILYVSVFLHGFSVSQAVQEEKSSRVMEVMLATVQARELMAGKILGVGAVGLTQIGIWGLASAVYPSISVAAGAPGIRNLVPFQVLAFFPVFFLLGYALYSSLYAAVGAIVDSQQEAQQLQQLVSLPMIVPLFLISYIVQYPESALSVAASMFPLSSPLIMFVRIAMHAVPWWQVAISVLLLLGTIYGTIVLCARVYRIGILMYGKKPTLAEILKWIKYA